MTDRDRLNPLFRIDGLRPHLEAGRTVITSNLRLSRKIRDAWRRDRCESGLETWEEPLILPLESWLEKGWLELLDGAYPGALAGAPATSHQESLLWQQVIAAADDLPATANPDNFADLARRGWKLVKQWRIDDDTLQNAYHNGARFLLRWGRAFEVALAERALIHGEQRAEIVLDGFREGALARLPAAVLVGFQTLPPLHLAVLEAGADELIRYRAHHRASTCGRASADDLCGEIALAAHWAKSRADENPGARIGVVVPRLTAIQPQVERIFCNTLDPERLLPAAGYRPTPYNISAARPLAEAPLVAAALQLLQLLGNQLSVNACCRLLNSPFWGQFGGENEPETDLRCQAQTELRALGLHDFPPARLRQLIHRLEIGEHGDVGDRSLSHCLSRLATLQRSLPAKLDFRQWPEIFAQALETLGWPGARPLDSLEYQQLDQWRQLLESLAALGPVAGPATAADALGELSALARDTLFHGESPDSQIQILGTLEAAGLAFDHLWVMNMEERQWPEPISPHPLLPVRLQQQLDMPRARPERELELSRELFRLFSASAGEVVFSHARREGDINLKPSLFLEELPGYAGAPAAAFHPWWQALQASSAMEIIEDAAGPAYDPPEAKLAGGSRFLSDQAQCPFNAFVRWRLGAESLGEPLSGLSPMWRGILVHDALEQFWRETGDSRQLLALGDGARIERLQHAADRVLADLFRSRSGLVMEEDFGRRLLALERQRLVRLLDNWLQLEMVRPPFRVEHTELNAGLVLDGLRLTLRLDRVDRLEDGTLAIIDYKTGQAGIAAVTGERLLEAQLPLYTLAMAAETGATPAAVAYARINNRNMGFDGLAEDGDLIDGCRELARKGLPETWEETLEQWREGLAALAGEIRDGSAEVAFYSPEAAAYGGDLMPLNRWPDLARLSGSSLPLPAERVGEEQQ